MVNAMTYMTSELSPGSEVSFRVSATNSVGEGASSECVSEEIAVIVPDVPTSVTTEVRGFSIVVNWEQPENGRESVTGYTVYQYKNLTCSGTAAESMVEGTSYMTSELSPGSEVSFRVSATNSVGEGASSECVSEEIAVIVPDVPTSVTTEVRGASIVVNWEEPENGGESVTGYTVYQYKNLTCSGTAAESMVEGTSYMTSELSPGSEVSFRVSATNSVGEGASSGCVDGEIEAGVPDVPTSVTTSVQGLSVIVDWQPPSSNGGESITGYTVYQYGNATCSGSGDKTMVNAMTYMTSELSPGSEVSFRVSATNSVGEGASSGCVDGEIEAGVPDVPTSVTTSVQGLSVIVDWQPPSSNGGESITGYTVYQYGNAICSGSEDKTMVNAMNYMTSELSPGSEVSFRVSATNSVGEGQPSECVNGEIEPEPDVPNPPPSVTIQVQGTSIVVSWQEPENGGDPIIEYTVYQYENATCSGSEDKTMVEGTTYMTSALSSDSEVSFRVSATNSVGEGTPSGCVNGEIESEPAVLDVPTSVTIQVQGTSIVVSWQEPANVRDSIIEYTLFQYENTLSCGGTPNEFITTALSYTITGLTPGSQTSIQVSASNDFGPGPPSECMMVQIPSPSEQKSADVRSLNVTLSHGYELSDSGIPEPYIKVDWRFEETQSFIIGFYREASCGILNQLVQKHSVASHTFTQGVAFDRSYSFQITAMGTTVRSECVSVFVPSPQCEALNPQTRGRYPNCCDLADSECVGRAQDLNLPATSSLLGREKFFQRLVEKDKVDAPSSLLIRILGETLTPPSERQESWTPSQGDRALSAFCYHKPGNCGQDRQGNNFFSPEKAQAIGIDFTGFDFSSPTLQQELIQAYRNSPQTAIVSVPRALETVTPNDLEHGAFLLVPVDGPNQEALLDVLPSLDREVFLPDGTTQSIPVMLFVTGYHDHKVVACGEAAPYCIVAPSQALLVDRESDA